MSKGNHVSDRRCTRRTSSYAAAALAIAAGLTGAGCSSSGSSSKAAMTSVASVPFPVAVGNTWKFTLTSSSGTSGTMTEKITSVVPVTGGRKVMMTETDILAGTPIREQWVYFLHSDGSITSSLLPQAGQANVVTSSTDGVNWPPAAVINSGRLVKLDVPTTIRGAERTDRATAHITIQGDGTATVTVPAGTYRAVIVSKTTTLSYFGMAHPVTSYDKTWLASGVGVVQEQLAITTTGAAFHSMTTIALKSFSKD
jgi:hypothetical protein